LAFTKEEKQELAKEFKLHEKDTGSASVQIKIISERITTLSEHLKINKKDHNSRKGLLTLVDKRRKLLAYLKKDKFEKYKEVCEKLGLK